MQSMYYLADNPWPLVLAFAATAIVAFLIGGSRGRATAGVALLLAIAVYLLEQQLISPGEQVEMTVSAMLDDFKERDLDGIIAAIDAAKPEIGGVAKQGLEMVDLSADFHIKNVEVTMDSDTRATALVRANGSVSLRKGGGTTYHLPNYWRTVWIKQDDQWVLTDYARLNPVNGQEIGVFSGQ